MMEKSSVKLVYDLLLVFFVLVLFCVASFGIGLKLGEKSALKECSGLVDDVLFGISLVPIPASESVSYLYLKKEFFDSLNSSVASEVFLNTKYYSVLYEEVVE